MKLTSSILSAIAVLLIYNVNLIIFQQISFFTSPLLFLSFQRQFLCRKIPRELKPFIKPADPGKFSDIADAFKDKIIRGKSRSYTITNTVLGRGFNGVVFLGKNLMLTCFSSVFEVSKRHKLPTHHGYR